jgi:hypothetical protein
MFAHGYFARQFFAPSYFPPRVTIGDRGVGGGYVGIRKRVSKKVGHKKVANMVARIVMTDDGAEETAVSALLREGLESSDIRMKPSYNDALIAELRRARRDREVSVTLTDDEAMSIMALID